MVQPGPGASAADMGLADVGTAVFGADVGIVACAAGPSAAESGVAGKGDVRGDGPCKRSNPGYAVADGTKVAVSGGCMSGCTAGAEMSAEGEVCIRISGGGFMIDA
jgi:hypothetical protein